MTTETEKLEKLTLDGCGSTQREANKALVESVRTYEKSSKHKLKKPVSRKYEISCVFEGEDPKDINARCKSETSFKDAIAKATNFFDGKYKISEFIVSHTYQVPKADVEKKAQETRKPAGRFDEQNSYRSIDRMFDA